MVNWVSSCICFFLSASLLLDIFWLLLPVQLRLSNLVHQMLSFSISYWDPGFILWVSFFESHILNARTYTSYVYPLPGFVFFCFLKSNIRKVPLSLSPLSVVHGSWSAQWLTAKFPLHTHTHTHLYICCIPKPAMILRITLFPQENRLDLTPMLWENWVKKSVLADSIISHLPPLLTSYLPTYDPLCQRTYPLGHILPPGLSLGLSLLALSEWLTTMQIAYQGCFVYCIMTS